MQRQRRARNPENYDEQGRVKKGRLHWKESQRYQATKRQHASTERKLAAYRKSLHGNLAHRIAQVGTTINIEKTSFKGWQKQYGRSIGLRAPGAFVAHLARIVAKTGGTLHEVSASQSKLSQYCHQCRQYHNYVTRLSPIVYVPSHFTRWLQDHQGPHPVLSAIAPNVG
jgi:hypothetical protein